MPTTFGPFMVHGFRDHMHGGEHVALTLGQLPADGAVLARIHSECLTGDVFGSLRCDCGPQRTAALQKIVDEQRGVFVYLRQEGRGIGLLNKLKAYALQDSGLDTVEANLRLGFAPDLRDYAVGAQILRALGASRVRLMTNNPEKIAALERYGVSVPERVPLQVGENPHNGGYLATKAAKLCHLLA
jgi:3,4-dihydroxy 2-butanone 4-phosphate synthase/GTP cyclohydrolase II